MSRVPKEDKLFYIVAITFSSTPIGVGKQLISRLVLTWLVVLEVFRIQVVIIILGNLARWYTGDSTNERRLHYELLSMMKGKGIFMDGNPGRLKYLLSKMGICGNHFKLPLVPVNVATEKALDDALKK